jgi:hypothetical protein
MENTKITFSINAGPRLELELDSAHSFSTFHDLVERLKERGATGIKVNGFTSEEKPNEVEAVANSIIREFERKGVSIRMNGARVGLDSPIPTSGGVVTTSGEAKGGRRA